MGAAGRVIGEGGLGKEILSLGIVLFATRIAHAGHHATLLAGQNFLTVLYLWSVTTVWARSPVFY